LLASRSPRRRQLLTEHGFSHDVIASRFDDSSLVPGRVTPRHWVLALAHLKAIAGVAGLEQQAEDSRGSCSTTTGRAVDPVVLAADTVVVKDDEIIGQPDDAEHAHRIITKLEDGEHTVITGVALALGGIVRWCVDESRVHVGDIGGTRINEYVASGGWRGKAGGYNLVERLDEDWPIEFFGDATSIMGLPMKRLTPMLQRALDAERSAADTDMTTYTAGAACDTNGSVDR
jgi:septum formation protein